VNFSGSVTVRSNKTAAKLRGVKAGTATATWTAAQAVRDEALRRVKRGKTGEVAGSIQIIGKEGDETVAVGSVTAEQHKGRPIPRWLENGTVKMHAKPFMRPSAAIGRKVLKAEAAAQVRAAADAS